MNLNDEQLLQVAIDAARAAGAIIREGWGRAHAIEYKGATNLVTETDRASEKIILDRLLTVTPDFEILAEESGTRQPNARAASADRRWVIDPVDGTTNYAHHFPYFAVSIGLEQAGESILGVVYDPILDQLFTAQRGRGAFLNGERIRCSQAPTVGQSVVATGVTYDVWETGRGVEEIVRMLRRTRSVRIKGCAALDMSYVACGRLDAYCDTGLSPWDLSAGRLVVTEAGGKVSSHGGDAVRVDTQFFIISNPHIHAELEQLLIAGSREQRAASPF